MITMTNALCFTSYTLCELHGVLLRSGTSQDAVKSTQTIRGLAWFARLACVGEGDTSGISRFVFATAIHAKETENN
jgi:hypothetical protein